MTTIVNIKHTADYDIFIGRPSQWGNPFSHLQRSSAAYKVATRAEAIERYRQWILNQPHLLQQLPSLKGKILGCYCKPKACHGDVLIELINNLARPSLF